MTRLEAMQFAMMNGAPAMPAVGNAPQAPAPQPAQPDVRAIIAGLRAALVAEHKARLAAEARLKRVLDQIAQTSPRATRPVAPQLPAAPPQVQAEVIDIRSRIREVGGDEMDEPEEAS